MRERKARSTEMRKINAEALKKAFHSAGISMFDASYELGYNPTYISKCCTRGRLGIETINNIFNKYGIDPETYVINMGPKKEAEPEPVAETVSSDVVDSVLFEVRHVSDIGETMYKKLNATTEEQTEMMREMIKLLKSVDKSCAYLMRAWEH